MLGCSKWGARRFFTNGNEFTYENWVNNKVQPVSTNAKLIPIQRPDNYFFKIGGSDGSIVDVTDHLKPLVEHISSEHANIKRMFEFPATMSFACNLGTKVCPIAGREHTSNCIYAVINLRNSTYSIRCHSSRCRDLTYGPHSFPCHAKSAIDAYYDRVTHIPELIPM
jgi:hypothetical protein